jgi:hypothetical protein
MDNRRIGEDLKVSSHDLIEVLSRNFHGDTEKTATNLSQDIRCPGRVSTPEQVSVILTLDLPARCNHFGPSERNNLS